MMTQIVVSKGNNVVRRGNIHLQEKKRKESRRQPRAAAGGSAARGNAGKARVPGSVFRRKGSVLAD